MRKRLTPLQFEVTQLGNTEPAYDNEYWNNKRDGLYVDVVGGDPLFSSRDQYDAGDGWPAFKKPLDEGFIRREADLRGGQARTVLRARLSNSYLGYLLHDGPDADGLHYRVNSASLRFIEN